MEVCELPLFAGTGSTLVDEDERGVRPVRDLQAIASITSR